MLPFLSSNLTTKSMLIQFNLISILERILKIHQNSKVQRYCLLTLRNLSDQIIHMVIFQHGNAKIFLDFFVFQRKILIH